MNHTFVLYDTKKILNVLEMGLNDLREICVISGTDYNLTNSSTCDLYTTLKYFKKYKKQKTNIHCKYISHDTDFYNWLLENTNYAIDDCELFKKTYDAFDFFKGVNEHMKEFDTIKIMNKNVLFSEMKEILKKDGFIFAR
jgi:uncharacterized ubiquitin-like protein YukD